MTVIPPFDILIVSTVQLTVDTAFYNAKCSLPNYYN
nr:MAG TPA: hypothetical protein [Caudoviricetes sp.]DAF10748.1 MAG TPA: hypothetical protein [Caudoviricetes sp.]DAF37033.1 MAG TPA: hypothetical protein [Caudoviricetes sp.]DAS88587.1 MAG TPA: hypothetical protein [Caudoviricetes sp.]